MADKSEGMFTNARAVEQVTWQMRLADYNRSLNRARIVSLANGAPPYTEDDERRNKINVNVNDLTLTRLSHDARLQLYQGFFKPGNFFTLRTDCGPADKRRKWGNVVTSRMNKPLKRSDDYYQCMLSKFAGLVLHGIGPSIWENGDRWCPVPVEIGDVMVPSRTLLTFRNMPFFAVWRAYSPHELRKLTRAGERNPGWQMETVNAATAWADEQTAKLFGGTSWSEYWVPEKRQERIKEDSGLYASDLVQTIDCWDFYYWDDAGKKEGWRRRMIFDASGGRGGWAKAAGKRMPSKNLIGDKGQFLFTSGDRVVASKLSELIHFQFADLSAVSPFRYHSVRSLGFLLFAACHLQNRLRCKFSEAVFENLMMYMRVRSLDEAERALKIELFNQGFVDESVQFLTPGERWQPNAPMIELGLNEYKQIIADNSSSYTQQQNFSRDRVEKTRYQVMAEVNAMQTLVSAALQQAYRYQTSEYREIARRFFKKGSTDPDVKDFQAQILKAGVPESYIDPAAWEVEPERVVGGGNKTLEMAIAQQLMEWRAAYSAEAQQDILRMATLAITDDAAQTEELVPDEPGVSDDKHDAQIAFGSIMAGAVVQFTKHQNVLVVAQALVTELSLAVGAVKALGGMTTLERVHGMQNVVEHVSVLVSQLAQDKAQAQAVRALAEKSGELANEIKGFAQRVKQKMEAEAQQAGTNGEAAKELIKLQAMKAQAELKQQVTADSHAQRTAQRQAQYEGEMQLKAEDHRQELQHKAEDHALDAAAKALQIRQQAAASKDNGSQQAND